MKTFSLPRYQTHNNLTEWQTKKIMNFNKQLRLSSCQRRLGKCKAALPLLANHGTLQPGCWISFCFIQEIPAGSSSVNAYFSDTAPDWVEQDLLLCTSCKFVVTPRLFFFIFLFYFSDAPDKTRSDQSMQTSESQQNSRK